MQAYTYIEEGKFALVEKPKPTIIDPTDAIVKVTLGSICKNGYVNNCTSPHGGWALGHSFLATEIWSFSDGREQEQFAQVYDNMSDGCRLPS